ncbi:MAG: DUF4468 domain-containing protein [Proteiniphilum sp.]
MKANILLFLALVPCLLFAQGREKLDTVNPIYNEFLPVIDGMITFSEVVQVDSLSKNDIFLRAHDWIIKTFNSAKDVIQFADKDAGKIVCKTVTGATVGKGWNKVTIDPVFYLLTIEVRSGRYKITASNFVHEYSVGMGAMKTSGSNPLESYYLLASPTKKEYETNIAFAEIIAGNIQNIFDSAFDAISEVGDEEW